MTNPLLDPEDTPLKRCQRDMARPDVTIERLVAMDVENAAATYGIPVDWVKYERERAITERGGKPWLLLKPKGDER